MARVEQRNPYLTVFLTEDKGGQYISVMEFDMAIAQATTADSRESPRTLIRAPVGLPTGAVLCKYPHV